MPGLLTDKVVMITGAASGIGRATGLICAREGARVVVTDRDAAGGAETLARIRTAGGEGAFVLTDVSDVAQIDAAVAFAVATYGRLDGAFNNAALPEGYTSLLDATQDTFDAIMKVNVEGVWHGMRAQIRQMRRQDGPGAIVNTASAAGLRGAALMAIYAASKHAVVGLTRSAGAEFARHGIRVNAVCPGVVETPMMAGVAADERALKAFKSAQPSKRFGQPEEIGEAVAWLLSDAASFVTGSAMSVDGGLTS